MSETAQIQYVHVCVCVCVFFNLFHHLLAVVVVAICGLHYAVCCIHNKDDCAMKMEMRQQQNALRATKSASKKMREKMKRKKIDCQRVMQSVLYINTRCSY